MRNKLAIEEDFLLYLTNQNNVTKLGGYPDHFLKLIASFLEVGSYLRFNFLAYMLTDLIIPVLLLQKINRFRVNFY